MRKMHNILELFEPLEGVTVSIKGQGNKSGPTPPGLRISRAELRRMQLNSKKIEPAEMYFKKVSLAQFSKKPMPSKGSLPRLDDRHPPASQVEIGAGGGNPLSRPPDNSNLALLMKSETDRDLLLLRENVRPKGLSQQRGVMRTSKRLNGGDLLNRIVMGSGGANNFEDEPRHSRLAVIPPNRLPRTINRRKSNGPNDILNSKVAAFW
jgi:hypothetical protein